MIRQAIRTLHLDQNYEWIIIGGAMIVAVVLDQRGSRALARRLSTSAAAASPSPNVARP
jgi:ribose transport system permease protein